MSTKWRFPWRWNKPYKRKKSYRHENPWQRSTEASLSSSGDVTTSRKKSKKDIERPSPRAVESANIYQKLAAADCNIEFVGQSLPDHLNSYASPNDNSSRPAGHFRRLRQWFGKSKKKRKSSSLRKERISSCHQMSLSCSALDEITQDVTCNPKNLLSVTADISKQPPRMSTDLDEISQDAIGNRTNLLPVTADVSKEQPSISTDEISQNITDNQVNPSQSKKDNSKPKSSFPTVSEMKEEDDEKDDYDTILEKKFLDSEYSIKDEVHEKLKRFSWLSGEYGFIGANKSIPHVHFYITVKNEVNESKVLEELEAAFDCKPNECFELRREPKTPKLFKYLARPAPGGGILAVEGGSNPLRVQGDIVDEEPGTLGTLTMFCFKNGSHCALTCFHIVCQTDEQRFRQAFNAKDLGIIRKSKSIEWYKELARTRKYHYRPREDTGGDGDDPAMNTHLGNFCEGSFDSVSDIMSIKVIRDVRVDCRVAEIDFPSWETIWRELHKRVVRRRERLPVVVKKVGYSSNETYGYIEEINYTLKYGDEVVLKNAIAVKSDDGRFMEPGDSGALVSFLDSEDREQVFGYGVCRVGDLAAEASASSHEENRSLFICLKLKTALEKLNLATETGCFIRCANDQ